ncbi:MAG: 3'-5' exonuclease [Saprospiraceae bacterium]|nr:exonuclease domain-containing protein [Lewinella sp.]
MNYIIFDLEATCWEQRGQAENETIEIGAVLIREKETISEFKRFVKPIKYPILSDFCKKLTSIQQADVDIAGHFYEVIPEFQSWIAYNDEPYILCSWGFYDRKQFESDCRLCNMETDWLQSHISLKHQYQEIKRLRRAVGMKTALQIEKIPLEGTHHRGIDDAWNIAKLFLRYFDQWKFPV